MSLYDTHAHLVTDDVERYPPAPLRGVLRPGSLDNPMTAERLLREMDANGVERAVVVQRAHVYGYDNRYVVDSANAHPDRLRAVCVIASGAADGAAQARRWLEAGAVGIRLTEPHDGADTAWLASDAAAEVWAETIRSGASVNVQFYRRNRLEGLAALPAMLEQFPRAKVVVEHVANLDDLAEPSVALDPPVLALATYPGVSFKVTTVNLERMRAAGVAFAPLMTALADVFGADRLMWGSDVAQSAGDYEPMVGLGRQAGEAFGAEDQAAFLRSTAQAVYGG